MTGQSPRQPALVLLKQEEVSSSPEWFCKMKNLESIPSLFCNSYGFIKIKQTKKGNSFFGMSESLHCVTDLPSIAENLSYSRFNRAITSSGNNICNISISSYKSNGLISRLRRAKKSLSIQKKKKQQYSESNQISLNLLPLMQCQWGPSVSAQQSRGSVPCSHTVTQTESPSNHFPKDKTASILLSSHFPMAVSTSV